MRYKTIQPGGRNGSKLYVHRVVWEAHNGPIPPGMQVDHINGDRLDNRIENLRLATNAQNNCNVGLNSRNTTGHKGISIRNNGKFRVQVKHGGVTIDKQFSDLDAAIAFAKETRNALHGAFANHG